MSPYYETHGDRRVELPLREREPVNRVDRESMRFFETEEKARRVAYRQEHKEYPDLHDQGVKEHCPVCHPELAEDSDEGADPEHLAANAEINALLDGDLDAEAALSLEAEKKEADAETLAEAEDLLEE
jgi:hypothetical protein